MPRFKSLIVTTLSLLAATTVMSTPLSAAEPVLEVQVEYTGKGSVDERHPLVLILFDGPSLGQPPTRIVAAKWLTQNRSTASFVELSADSVYLAVLYDLHGGLSGLNIPSGTPLNTYRTDDSADPSPIRPGPGARVEIALDDSQLFPGRPTGEDPLDTLRAADRGIVEIRMYTVKEGRRDDFVRFFEEQTLSPQLATGMRMLGQFRSLENENLFVWIRSFPNQEERVRQEREFYMGTTWLEHLSPGASEMIDSTEVLLVEPTLRSLIR